MSCHSTVGGGTSGSRDVDILMVTQTITSTHRPRHLRRRVDVLVVRRLPLGNLKHLMTLLDELQAVGVSFVSLGEGIDHDARRSTAAPRSLPSLNSKGLVSLSGSRRLLRLQQWFRAVDLVRFHESGSTSAPASPSGDQVPASRKGVSAVSSSTAPVSFAAFADTLVAPSGWTKTARDRRPRTRAERVPGPSRR